MIPFRKLDMRWRGGLSLVALACCMWLTTSCIDEPLSADEIDERIDDASGGASSGGDATSGGGTTDGGSADQLNALQVADCLATECQQNANNCSQTCMAKAEASAKAAGEALWACWKPKCADTICKGSADSKCVTRCLIQRCGPETIAMLETGKSKDQGCASTLNCMQACDPAKKGLFVCLNDCHVRATKDGQAGVTGLGACSSKNEGDALQKCQSELVTCAAPAGAMACKDILSCVNNCTGGNDAKQLMCVLTCMGKSTNGGAQAYATALGCVSPCKTKCGGKKGCDAQCSKECKTELAACAGK